MVWHLLLKQIGSSKACLSIPSEGRAVSHEPGTNIARSMWIPFQTENLQLQLGHTRASKSQEACCRSRLCCHPAFQVRKYEAG